MLGRFRKSILANGENVFNVDCCCSFSEPHTARRIQVNTEVETEMALPYRRKENGPEFRGELESEEPFPCALFPNV